jgi:hypothetical protein
MEDSELNNAREVSSTSLLMLLYEVLKVVGKCLNFS